MPIKSRNWASISRHLAAQGKRGERLRQYEQLVTRLDGDLGVELLGSTYQSHGNLDTFGPSRSDSHMIRVRPKRVGIAANLREVAAGIQ